MNQKAQRLSQAPGVKGRGKDERGAWREENNLEPWLSALLRFTFFSVRWASMSVMLVAI